MSLGIFMICVVLAACIYIFFGLLHISLDSNKNTVQYFFVCASFFLFLWGRGGVVICKRVHEYRDLNLILCVG